MSPTLAPPTFAPSNTKDMFHTVEDILNPTEARERFKAHFLSAPVEEEGQKWSELWDNKDFLPWDKGVASPALVDLLAANEENRFNTHDNDLSGKKKRKRALVPGCGRGYDVLLLAEHGYDAVGVDISKAAIKDAHAWIDYQVENIKATSGAALKGAFKLVDGDFFKDNWVESLNIEVEGGFDIIYDYAFLVALNPVLRTKVAARMTQLLTPKTGLLVALEYPLFRPVETGGPPHGIKSEDYQELFGSSFERVIHYKPERTHTVGEGSDMVSIWKKN